MAFTFNQDGSLAVDSTPKKGLDHIPVLLTLEEVPFGMGKKLLLAHLRGVKNAQTTKLRLDRYISYGQLGGFDDSELLTLFSYLEGKGLIETRREKGIYQVFALTSNGIEELQRQELSININGLEERVDEEELERISIQNTFPPSAELTLEEEKLALALSDFVGTYTPRQQKAIITSAPKILCVAGAGSGKTSVLTKRIVFLHNYKSVPAKKILAITFTRKAREEMQVRLAEQLPGVRITVETFNSFSEKLLQKHGARLGFEKHMITPREQIELLLTTLKKNGYTQSKIIQEYFTPRQQQGKDSRSLFFSFRYDFQSLIDKIRLSSLSIDELRNNIAPNKSHTHLAQKLLTVAENYLSLLAKEGFRDYTDQLLDALTLLREHPDVTPYYSHILVDEYQDVNDQQIALLDLLDAQNLFVVGDPRQSIYGWRGSRMSHILDFPKRYTDAEIIQLTTNFRSTNTIVDICNHAIRKTGYEDLKSAQEEKGSILLNYYRSEDEQASSIANSIVGYEGKRKHVFVLARTNKSLEKMRNACEAKGIAYLLRTDEQRRLTQEAQEHQITLATVHAIKGLEAERVYVMNVNAMNFPCKASEHPVMDLYSLQEDYDSYAEELRVLYVALSRAKKELFVSYTGSLSPFLTTKIQQLFGKETNSTITSVVDKQEQKRQKLLRKDMLLSKTKKPITDVAHAMFTLRQWRYKKAKERGCPAYVICSDSALEAAIDYRPKTADDLLAVPGFGPARVGDYGDELVGILTTL